MILKFSTMIAIQIYGMSHVIYYYSYFIIKKQILQWESILFCTMLKVCSQFYYKIIE